jgi:hypothetical protein
LVVSLTSETQISTANRSSLKVRIAVALGSLFLGAVLGIGSAYYAFSTAGISPVPEQPGWVQRSMVSTSSTLPYELGHYLVSGQLPPPKSVMDLWRETTADGAALRGDCMITFDGTIPPARWWTLAAVNKDGVADGPRSVLTASSAVFEADGRIVVHIAVDPRPGNWVAPVSGGTYSLALTLHDPVLPLPTGEPLPSLKREGC